jgi:membrane protein YqaA with SNARE-associated domain
MSHLPTLIADLALILMSASIITLLFKWLKQPLVLGYIVAGLLAGPYVRIFPTVGDMENINTWAEIGVVFLLFALGLVFSFKKLMNVGSAAFITATTEVISMLLIGFMVGHLLGWSTMNSVFLGGLTCYWLGHLGKIEWIEKWLRIKKEKVDGFNQKFHKYGDWLAFFSFLPGVGDIIAVAAGFMRCRFWIVAVSMLLGKFLRYVVWMYVNGLFL